MSRFARGLAALIVAAGVGLGLLAWWVASRPAPPAPAEGRGADEQAPRAAPRRPDAKPREAPREPAPLPRGVGESSDVGAPRPPAVAQDLPALVRALAGPNECDDGDPCTRFDKHVDGYCRGEPLDCDDDDPNTIDECTGDGCLFRVVSRGAPPGQE